MLDWILRRWHLKLLALGLAFAVWIAVTGEGSGVQDFRVPIDLALAPDVAVTGAPPTGVVVRLRGPEALLRRLDPYDLTVRVDMRDASGGERTVQLNARNVTGVPSDLEVALVEPDHLRIALAKKKRRQVTVAPTIVGKPPRGYQVYAADARPEALEVEGPETKLASLAKLRTDPIRVDDRTEPFVTRVGIVPEGSDVRVTDARPLDVSVYIDLAPVSTSFDRLPIVVAGAEGGAVAVPATVDVVVQAPSALVAKLRGGGLRAVAEAGAGGATALQVPLRIEFPGLSADERAKVRVVSMTRRAVDVRRSHR